MRKQWQKITLLAKDLLVFSSGSAKENLNPTENYHQAVIGCEIKGPLSALMSKEWFVIQAKGRSITKLN